MDNITQFKNVKIKSEIKYQTILGKWATGIKLGTNIVVCTDVTAIDKFNKYNIDPESTVYCSTVDCIDAIIVPEIKW